MIGTIRLALIRATLYTSNSKGWGMETIRYIDQADERLHAKGLRPTESRSKVLAVLLESGRALTHHQIQTFSGRLRDLDRVTVYRVLQWLEKNGLVHKFADEGRVWRFMAGDGGTAEHPHFKCERCGSVICLEDAEVQSNLHLPSGYSSKRMELTVLGLCSVCTPPKQPASTASKAKAQR